MPYKDPDQQREYQRRYVAAARREYLADKQCAVCGAVERLELDHIDPAQKVSHRIWSWAPYHREMELAKCQVLCHTHHVEKTQRERGHGEFAPHGSRGQYALGCRCEVCKEWKRSSRTIKPVATQSLGGLLSKLTIRNGRDFKAAEHLGTTVALIGKEFRPSIKTVNGARPAYKADVAILAGPNEGDYFEDALIFQSALVSQLKKAAAKGDDTAVIGELTTRETEDGENSYFLVADPTTAELRLATKYGV